LTGRARLCPSCFRSDGAPADGRCGACGFVATSGRCIECDREGVGRIVVPDTSPRASERAWWQPPPSAADRVRLQERERSLEPAFLCRDCMADALRAAARAKVSDALAAALAVAVAYAIFGASLLVIGAAIVAITFLSFALGAWSLRRAPYRRPKRVVELLRRHVRTIELERR
jgi:hypothetical protein